MLRAFIAALLFSKACYSSHCSCMSKVEGEISKFYNFVETSVTWTGMFRKVAYLETARISLKCSYHSQIATLLNSIFWPIFLKVFWKFRKIFRETSVMKVKCNFRKVKGAALNSALENSLADFQECLKRTSPWMFYCKTSKNLPSNFMKFKQVFKNNTNRRLWKS